jgi:tripeptidyl-peptidase I
MKGFFRAATAVAIISQLLSITNATVFHSNDQAANDVNPTHVFREESRGLSSANNFIRGERSASTDFHDVTFAVKLANLEEMERIFLDISNPSSPNFGKHMTKDEVDDLTANPTALQFVLDHLKSAGATILPDQSLGPYNIKARAPVALWESMFDTEFFAYSHTSGHAIGNVVRAEKYSVPAALDEHVSSVFNTIQTPHVRSHKLPLADHMNTPAATEESLKLASLLLNDLTTPQLLNNAYEITDNIGHPKATQAIFSMYDQMYSPDDITTFQEYVTVPLQKVNKTIGVGPTTVAMCAADNDKCAEGNADLSYIMALSNSPTYYYGTSSYSLAEWIQADVVQSSDPPKVISISYGADEIYVSAAEYDSFQTSAISLGLRGVTIVVSSGDDGVHSYDARGNTAKCGYMPGFPASCPYVTSVGATQVSGTRIVTRCLHPYHTILIEIFASFLLYPTFDPNRALSPERRKSCPRLT